MKKLLYLRGGPSREGMFDSLRLNLKVQIDFSEMTGAKTQKGNAVTHNARIISIKRLDENKPFQYNHEWEIEVLFKGKFSSEKYQLWKGTYSTHSRSGMPIEEN